MMCIAYRDIPRFLFGTFENISRIPHKMFCRLRNSNRVLELTCSSLIYTYHVYTMLVTFALSLPAIGPRLWLLFSMHWSVALLKKRKVFYAYSKEARRGGERGWLLQHVVQKKRNSS